MDGKIVLEKSNLNEGESIDVSAIESGSYIVKTDKSSFKLIIE